MDSPRRVPPSLRLGGTYFPVLLWAGCAGSGSDSQRHKRKNRRFKYTSTKRLRRTLNLIIAMMRWKYLNLQAYPCLRWKVQAVQPAPSAWDPGCPCMDSEWSNGLLCKYDKTQSSVLSACSWDPHPGLGHLGPILVKKRYNHSGQSFKFNIEVKVAFHATQWKNLLGYFLPLCWKWRSWRRHHWLWW